MGFRSAIRFCCKDEHHDFRLGDTAVRSVMLCCDVMDPEHQSGPGPSRWWPAVRHWDAVAGRWVGRWQIQTPGSGGVFDGPWTDLEDGTHRLAFNRSPTKYQWHYLRLTFDLRPHGLDLHCYGRDFAVAGLRHQPDPPLPAYRASTDRCWGLVAVCFAIETGEDRRSLLFLDSVVVSADEGTPA